MAEAKNRDLPGLCRRFVADQLGSITFLAAFGFIALAGMMGAAVDYSGALRTDAKLQAGLDSAVLAAVRNGTDSWETVADDAFDHNVPAAYRLGASPTFTRNADGDVTGSISVTYPTNLVRIVGITSIPITTNSTASANQVYDNSCILTLGTGEDVSSDSITFNGAPSINLNQCTLRSNTSMRCNGHDSGSVASIAAGDVSGCSNPQPNSAIVPDIYQDLANNIPSGCGAPGAAKTWSPGVPPAGITISNKGSHTEYHVCGDLILSGTGYLTGSAPGADSVTIVDNGSLRMANDASISAMRVTFVLTGDNTYASQVIFPNGNGKAATLTLSPSIRADNPWRGVSLYQNPVLTNVDNDWGPGATLNPDGIVYLPNSDVTMRGNSATGLSGCTKFVSRTLRTNGNVNLSYKQTAGACANIGVEQWFEAEPHISH